ncbi:MAG: hypothetical protein ACRC8S_05055 [Fimbriiglobus sp.]
MRYQLGPERLERRLRLLHVACCRRIWPYLTDQRSRHAVEITEQYLDGLAGTNKLEVACSGALTAYEAIPRARNAEHTAASVAATVASWDYSKRAFDISDSASDLAAMVPAYTSDGYNLRLRADESAVVAGFIRDILGNPFRLVAVAKKEWLTSEVRGLALNIHQGQLYERLPILADALQEAGCWDEEVLNHCRGPGPHVRGCWVVDMLLSFRG